MNRAAPAAKSAAHSRSRGGADASAVTAHGSIRWFLIPMLVCAFTLIVSELMDHLGEVATYADVQTGNMANKLFWPIVAALPFLTLIRQPTAVFNRRTSSILASLLICLMFCGLTVFWAFKPSISLSRYAQQMMLVTALVVPIMRAPRTADLMHSIFICYSVAAVLNLCFILMEGSQTLSMGTSIGYNGYFSHKNTLGEAAAFTVFLALAEMSHKGTRRIVGFSVLVIAAYILVLSRSKTSIALGVALPILALLLTGMGQLLRRSPVTLFYLLLCAAVISCRIFHIDQYDISEKLFKDRTFTGRTEIWDFVSFEINRRYYGGWGFQSFWLVGLDGPSFTDTKSWIRTMPEAHNGYLDVQLSTGTIGLALLLVYIALTLTAIGRLAKFDQSKTRLLFTMALFIILSNFLESTWFDGHGFQWPLFLLISAEAARLTSGQVKKVGDVARRRNMREPTKPVWTINGQEQRAPGF